MSVMKSVSALIKAAISMLGDAMDPVCQNKDALILGRYKGYCVRMVPIVDSAGHVEKWILDADKVKRIDSMIAAGEIKDMSVDMHAGAPPAQLPPIPTSAPTAPPVLPPTFNPAGVPGI